MAENGYGLAGRGWDWQNLSISTGLRRASAVLLRYHMKQQSAAFHAAGAAFKKHPPRPEEREGYQAPFLVQPYFLNAGAASSVCSHSANRWVSSFAS